MKIKKIFAGLICVLIVGISVILGLVLSEGNPEPMEFANKEISESSESILFLIDRVRYPAKAAIIPMDPMNSTMRLGISPETYELNFGIMPPNITVRKFINLQNNENSRVKICVITYGDIKPMVSIKESDIIMDGGGSSTVEVAFNASMIGNYAGEINVISRKPKYGVLDYVLPLLKC